MDNLNLKYKPFSDYQKKNVVGPWSTYIQWKHKSKKSEVMGRCGRQNMLPLYLKIWDWDSILGHAVKAISSPGIRRPE